MIYLCEFKFNKMKKIFYLLLLFPSFILGQNPYNVSTKEKNEKNEVKLSTEEQFVKDNFEYLFITDWYEGMRFMVPKKRDFQTDISLYPYKKGQSFSKKIRYEDFEFEIFKVVDIEEREIRNNIYRTVVVLENDGKKYESYEMLGSIEKLKSSNSNLFTTIGSLVSLDEVDIAKKLLLDSSLFIMTNFWVEDADNRYGYNQVKGTKFSKVKIVNVGVGVSTRPVKLIFETEDGNQYYRNVSFSGTNSQEVYMKNFSDIFSFSNPRLKYPNINDEIWQLIQQEKVKIGMSKDECVLSWGKPKDINETIFENSISEQWVYEKNYLYFENGVLKTIQD